MNETAQLIQQWLERFEVELGQSLETGETAPGLLREAMAYSVLAGGKRIRPLVVYAAATALGSPPEELDTLACSIEIIHTYSLIHDDLPAMDDDDLRRGRPTCHKAFDEATAILAGDALQALAFELLAGDARLGRHPARQARIIASVARACGAAGMAGGQVLDLAAVGEELRLEELERMHSLKTGALIRVSATAPALFAGASPDLYGKLERYGDRVGLAFQIHDDVLDVTGNSKLTGKAMQKDATMNKPTFPAIIGLDASRRRAEDLRDQALAELDGFPADCGPLAWLAGYAIDRDS
jgi:farnesyl diphosphate synthase